MIPQKELGQIFLSNPKVVDKIISIIKPNLCKNVVEIGPGKGVFTFKFSQISENILAIEKDPNLSLFLKNTIKMAQMKNIKVKTEDILTYDFSAKISHPYSVFGSLPYNKSKKIIEKFLFLEKVKPKNLFFIIQKEVASKYLCKSPNQNYYSMLAQLASTPKKLFDIDPGSFTPTPRVKSTLIEFTLNKNVKELQHKSKFLKIIFHQPRKTIKNNIPKTLLDKHNFKTKNVEKILTKRASQLTINEVNTLLAAITSHNLSQEQKIHQKK